MKILVFDVFEKAKICVFLMLFSLSVSAQDASQNYGGFWSHVRFGGGVGAGFGSDYTNVTLAPSALYEFNKYVGLGLGLQGSYVKVKGDRNVDELNNYDSWIYGGSILGIFNPVDQIQLSLEVEEVRVNSTFNYVSLPDFKDNFWNTALFVGAGYRAQNVTIGVRYNLLFDKDKSVYHDAFMPFVRVYF